MMTDLEDLLRQGIDRLPGEVPADLAHRAGRQARRRRLVTGLGAGVTAAAVAIAVVVAGVVSFAPTPSKSAGEKPGRPVRSARPARTQHLPVLPSWAPGRITHATLVSRVERAVLTSTKFIAYTRRYDYAHRSRLIVTAWDYRNMHLLVWDHPHSAQLVTNYPHRETVKFVWYQQRQWALTRWPFSGVVRTDKNQCVGPADDSPQPGDPRWAAWLVSSLRCGAYTVTSRSGADGTPILHIVNTPKDVEYKYGVRLHILVDATTYLPIADWQTGSVGYYDVIKWLPPTKALLARLALPVPAGFSQPKPHRSPCRHAGCG